MDGVLTTLLDEHGQLQGHKASLALLAAAATKRHEVAALAKAHGVRSLAIFGSALHGDAQERSDLDLLVEFQPGRTPGFIGLGTLERDLADLLGVRVDLQTPGSLSKYIRDGILREALPIYVSA